MVTVIGSRLTRSARWVTWPATAEVGSLATSGATAFHRGDSAFDPVEHVGPGSKLGVDGVLTQRHGLPGIGKRVAQRWGAMHLEYFCGIGAEGEHGGHQLPAGM